MGGRNGEARDHVEHAVRRLVDEGDLNAALEAALRGYGPEIYGFLVGLQNDEATAADAFSRFSEALWRGLPAFNWHCTLRTWAYVLARNASHRLRIRNKHAGREVPLATDFDAAAVLRTATAIWRRTETKNQFAELRAALAPEDRELLVLRVDRGLDWNEIARVMLADEDVATSEDARKRKAAQLRKRFQFVRVRLHELARRAGLVAGEQAQ